MPGAEERPMGSAMFGVSVRSWCALVIIVLGMGTVCYLAVTEKDPQWVLVPLSTALGFLFGKPAGRVEAAMRKQDE